MLKYKKVYTFIIYGDFMPSKILIIGAGPAGYPAALTAAKLGAQVTVVEKALAGGVCLHSGCIPSKSLLEAAHRFDAVRGIGALCQNDVQAQTQAILKELSWPKIQQRQLNVSNKLAAGILSLFRMAKINYIEGVASFKDEHTVTVAQKDQTTEVTFDYVIIASGTTAFIPAPFDKIRSAIYDNSTIFKMPALPQKMVIVGGGAIGCEFATLMSSLGVAVTLVEMQPRLLPNMDENISRLVGQSLQKRGVTLLLGQSTTDARVEDDRKILTLQNGTELETDEVLVAIGRQCDMTQLHPENAGLSWNRKGLQGVNAQTLQVKDHIYAAGDVTGLTLLAHAGTRQGIVAAHNICGQAMIYNNDLVPNAVYTVPEVAGVGLTRAQAQARGLDVKVQKAFMMANGRALTMDTPEGFVEIVSEKATGKLLGAVLAGPNASEIISAFTVALEAGFTTEQLSRVIFPHPAVSEAIGDALAK